MKKISINICTTPNCYIKGANLFKQLNAMMSTYHKHSITLTGTGCPGYCAKCGSSQSPCASVNGRIIPQAQAAEILQATRECLA